MSSIDDKFRPQLHFSPKFGWINDPNGLIYLDGVYHAFYQHDPHSVLHGPMHWGHATTTDLVNWMEHPVALYPDENGTCFSGSAVRTGDGATKLIYTSHKLDVQGRDYQQQCLVHANSSLTAFTKDRHPVVANPGLGCFRDPKVFWHEETSRWTMALAQGETVGQSIGFYSSVDLVHWTFESSFGDNDGRHSDGPWECPDLLRLLAPDGKEHWVLIVGIGNGAYGAGSGTMYFVGQFDGHAFTNSNPASTELWLDYGRDYYAAQTFHGVHEDAPLALAWGSNWKYARQTPTENFTGLFALPRHIRLAETPAGLRLAAWVPEHVKSAFPTMEVDYSPVAPNSPSYRISTTFELGPDAPMALRLFGEDRPQFVFWRDADGKPKLRQFRAELDDLPEYGHEYDIPLVDAEVFELEVFVDSGFVELAVNELVWSSNVYFPVDPAGALSFGLAAVD